MYDNSLIDHLGRDRPTNSSPYARKCAHGHMYHVLETFQRAKSPTRLSGGWSRLVRQVSDAPLRARSTDKFLTIRTKMCTRTHVPRARHLPPGELAHSAKLQVAAGNLYDNSLMHHFGLDRPTNSSRYAPKCAHGHMYHVLDTFRRENSPIRLSGGWRQLVRQVSDAPPRARSTDKFLSVRTKMCTRTHVPRARNLPEGEIAHSAKWRLESTCTTSL